MTGSTTAKIAVGGLVLSWLPLTIVAVLGISDNPIGLGLLAWAGTALVVVFLAVMMVVNFVRFVSD